MLSPKLKQAINLIFLGLSCAMSIYFLSQITTNILVKGIIIVFVIVYEVTMQYILSLGKAKWQKGGVGPILTAALYFFFYSIYVFVYALPSALGFFVAEIAVQEEAAAAVVMEKSVLEEQFAINQQTITALNRQLEHEAETGYGARSRAIMEQLTRLREEQKEIQEKLFGGVVDKSFGKESSGTLQTSRKVSKDAFKALTEVLNSFIPITENLLKMIVFSTTILMLYLGLILTAWDVDETEKKERDRTSRAGREDEEDRKNKESTRQELMTMTNRKRDGSAKSSLESLEESSPGSFESSQESSLESSKESFKSSSESSPAVRKVPKPDSEWERFIRASIRETGNLNSPRRVSMLTGIPIDRCAEYRKRLDEMKIGGEPVIETVQGGSRANFGKEVILERIREAI